MVTATETRDNGASSRPWDAPPGYRFEVPPFPNCWFQVAYTDELAAGAVVPLRYFGKDLVLFRGDDGVARVVDAFCPPRGPPLDSGSAVIENPIRCPFHFWRFDGEGRCVDVPYANKIPPLARLDGRHVCEKNGLIIVFHHINPPP